MRYRKNPDMKPTQEDIKLGWQLRNALAQTEGMPDTERWRLTMELLPDEYHYQILLARKRSSVESAMSLYGLLVSAIQMELEGPDSKFDPQTDMGKMTLGIIAVPTSSLAELEHRYKQFCDDVTLMDNPLEFDPNSFPKYVPRDPENFSVPELREYYTDRAQAALK